MPVSCDVRMAATILTFGRTARVPVMSVADAAFYAYFENPDGGDPVQVISSLTGVSVRSLHRLWGGPRGLREAAIRHALGMAMG